MYVGINTSGINGEVMLVDRADIEGNAHNGPVVRLPFASSFNTLGMCLKDENYVLLLYSLVHGNIDFEYCLVRTDLDTLLLPILETLYNAQRRTSNQIYMLLIILLILSQDSSFNATIHKLTRIALLDNERVYNEMVTEEEYCAQEVLQQICEINETFKD